MAIAIIILATLLLGAVAFIFWLLQVLKNTLETTDGLVQLLDGKTPKQLKKAYNDKYYPAAVIAKIIFNSPSEGKIVDFSMYEKYKLVGFTVLTQDSPEKYYGKDFLDSLDDESRQELDTPVLIKKALVYEVTEGNWLWKSAD
jgi:hypothetical protein